MRVRLINRFEAELAQLNTSATALDPDGPGVLTKGYDDDFNEPVVTTSPAGTRDDARRENPLVRIPCQIEPGMFEMLVQLASGDSPDSRVVLCFLFSDLEALGLVDEPTGEARIRKGDRLHAIYERCGGPLVQIIRNPPGLYVTQSAFGAGIGRGASTLLATFEERERGARTAQG